MILAFAKQSERRLNLAHSRESKPFSIISVAHMCGRLGRMRNRTQWN